MDRLIQWLLYALGRSLVFVIQLFPLTWVAAFGRLAGRLAFVVDKRHRRVAIGQLEWYLEQTQTEGDPESMAREHYQRLGENYVSAIKTAGMSSASLRKHLEFEGLDMLQSEKGEGTDPEWNRNWVFAIGHFGNFELYARCMSQVEGFTGATTYRGLNQPGLDRLLQELRARSGVLFFDRRKQFGKLRQIMNEGSVMLGLLADQVAGSGTPLEFLGDECLCSTAPAVFAHRYHCRLGVGVCYRVGPAKWKVVFDQEIPTFSQGERRSVESITKDVNKAFEKAIHRDPLNWFWVHDRWKRYRKLKKKKPASPAK